MKMKQGEKVSLGKVSKGTYPISEGTAPSMSVSGEKEEN